MKKSDSQVKPLYFGRVYDFFSKYMHEQKNAFPPYHNETNTALWRSPGRKSRRLKNEARVFLPAKTMSRRLEWRISAHGRG